MTASAVLTAVALLLASGAYVARWRSVRAAQGAGAASVWRLTWFFGAMLALVLAAVFPFPGLAERALTLHVAQHILVFDVAPMLLVASTTAAIVRPLEPFGRRVAATAIGRVVLRPIPVLVLYVATLWFWHIPALYDAALRVPALHVVQHAALLGAAIVFWWVELAPARYRRTGEFSGVLYIIGAKVLTGTLSSLLAFSNAPLFEFYLDAPRLLGQDAVEDQKMGGAIMILVESVIFLLAVTALFIRMLGESGHDEVDEATGPRARG